MLQSEQIEIFQRPWRKISSCSKRQPSAVNNLQTLFQALMTAKPTSVEFERTFSVGGGFATKIRSRLSDKSLSALVMLKAYFKR